MVAYSQRDSMFSYLLCVVVLIVGYIFYETFVEKIFGPDDRTTTTISVNDGVDYVPMKIWKVSLIQLLNIAVTGPIFGALLGALFDPVAYLWIIFGNNFAGAVHDYLCGMISMRTNDASISEITGNYLGKWHEKRHSCILCHSSCNVRCCIHNWPCWPSCAPYTREA